MANVLLNLNNVSKTIDKQRVVHPFNMALERGRALALCGANGAGKSTIIRMIAGITQPTTGTIKLNDLEWVSRRKAYAEQLGYMPDDFQFGASLSAWETICFYASLRGIGKDRVHEVLETVDLYGVSSQSVATYSKGMRQRLMFAQAMLTKPALLLLDEPTNGLDPYWTSMFVELVLLLKQSGTTIIYSTHQLQVAEQSADEAVFLHQGQIMSSGTVKSYIEQYGSTGLDGAYADFMKIKS